MEAKETSEKKKRGKERVTKKSLTCDSRLPLTRNSSETATTTNPSSKSGVQMRIFAPIGDLNVSITIRTVSAFECNDDLPSMDSIAFLGLRFRKDSVDTVLRICPVAVFHNLIVPDELIATARGKAFASSPIQRSKPSTARVSVELSTMAVDPTMPEKKA